MIYEILKQLLQHIVWNLRGKENVLNRTALKQKRLNSFSPQELLLLFPLAMEQFTEVYPVNIFGKNPCYIYTLAVGCPFG